MKLKALLAFVYLFSNCGIVGNQYIDTKNINENNVVTLSKESKNISDYDIEMFSLDEEILSNSSYVTSQIETIQLEETNYLMQDGVAYPINEKQLRGLDEAYKSDVFTEPGGYVTLSTSAYQVSTFDKHPVYYVSTIATINKSFFVKKTDDLIIRTDTNSVFYDGFNCRGTGKVYDISNGQQNHFYDFNIDPIYSSTHGIDFKFKPVQSVRINGKSVPTKTVVYGEYYFVATDTSSVQPVYIHNQSWFIDSLSVSVGPIGVNFPFKSIDAAIYYGKPLTLTGQII